MFVRSRSPLWCWLCGFDHGCVFGFVGASGGVCHVDVGKIGRLRDGVGTFWSRVVEVGGGGVRRVGEVCVAGRMRLLTVGVDEEPVEWCFCVPTPEGEVGRRFGGGGAVAHEVRGCCLGGVWW